MTADMPCSNLFYSIEIREDGKVNLCSPAFLDYNDCYLGNIFEESFDDIWNGEKARNLRRLAIEGKYPYCHLEKCELLASIMFKPDIDVSGGFSEVISTYPNHVVFTHDFQCNVRCVFCRDCLRYNPAEKRNEMDKRIYSHYLPILKDAKIVKLQGAGEIFASGHSRKLTKAIAEKYPDIKFHLQSNGILFNRRNCDAIGITNRIYKAVICAHAATRNTYDNIVKGGNFKAVMDNIEWLGELKKDGKIEYFYLGFVVTGLNYTEMKDYLLLAKKYGAHAYFVELRVENDSAKRNGLELNITDPRHPEYYKLAKLLQDEIFIDPVCRLDKVFREMKKINAVTRFYNTVKNYCSNSYKTNRNEASEVNRESCVGNCGTVDKIGNETNRIKKKSFLIFPPAQGFGSFGDQAMMLGVVSWLNKKYENPSIGFLHYNESDDFVSRIYPNVRNSHLFLEYGALNETSVKEFINIISEYNVLILIGADVLDGYYNINQIETFARLAELAHEAGLRVVTIGFSHNGEYNQDAIDCYAQLGHYARLNIRDEVSLERMRGFGITDLCLVADSAFLFNHREFALGDRTREFYDEMLNNGQKYVGINVNFRKDETDLNSVFVNKLTETLSFLKKDDSHDLILIPHDIRETATNFSDTQSLGLLKKKLDDCGYFVHFPYWITTQAEAKYITELCEMTIGNRMHLAISALSLGVPPVSFVYQGKFEGLYKFYDWPCKMEFDKNTFSVQELGKSIACVLDNRKRLGAMIKSVNVHTMQLAEKNLETI